jgi:hypothetical protein
MGRNGCGRKKLMRDYKREDRDRRKGWGMRWVERKGKIQEEKRESLEEKEAERFKIDGECKLL